MNSLYLITHLLRLCKLLTKFITKSDIENLAIKTKENAELSGRSEVNLIDVLNTLVDKGITKELINSYIKETKIKFRFAKQGKKLILLVLAYIGKIAENEEMERESLIRKINSNNITGKKRLLFLESNSISANVLKAIPKHLRYFPRDFALKETEVKI